jgi:hypothetical protein
VIFDILELVLISHSYISQHYENYSDWQKEQNCYNFLPEFVIVRHWHR